MITPTLKAIKETYPESKTIFLISSKAKGIFEGSPYIDELLYHVDGESYLPVLLKIWKADLALLYDNNSRTRTLAWIARIKNRLGFGTHKKRFLTDYIKENGNINIFSANTYLDLSKRAGITTEDLSLHVPVCESKEKNLANTLLTKYVYRYNDKFITIGPYSSSYLKDWPEEYYNEIIDKFSDYGYSTVLIGGSELKEKATIFKNAIYIPEKLSPKQSTYIISKSCLFLCGCTFSLHLASTTNTPIIALYGPTSPKQWVNNKNCTTINHNLSCSPCLGSETKCQLDKKCLKDITADEVFETAMKIMNKRIDQQHIG